METQKMMHLKAVKSVNSVKVVKTVISSKILKGVKCAKRRCLPGQQGNVEWSGELRTGLLGGGLYGGLRALGLLRPPTSLYFYDCWKSY